MTSELKQVPIIECIDLIGGGTPKTSVAEYWDGDIPWLSVKDFNNDYRYVFTTEKHITEAGLNNSSTKLLQKDDIIISARGTVGEMAMIPFPMAFNQSCYGIRAKDGVNSTFLYYLLKSSISKLKRMTHGSVFDTITRDTFATLIVGIPDRSTQDTIAETLAAIDDKIEINNKINDNLQQQAQELFESWFVNYTPWNGERPASWGCATLGDFVEIKRGGSPRPIQDYLSVTGLRWLKISDVTSLSSPFVTDIKEHIKESGLRKTVLLKSGSLVLSNSATPGIPKILDVDSCIHDGWLYFPKSKFSKYYLYLFFKHIRKQLVALGNGSVFTNLKTDILRQFPSVMPDASVLADFDSIVTPLFEGMLNVDRENRRLVGVRDALLPRLMSGEIDVSNIDI
ncbi:MAG: restriction endonuclease subunit S [Acutalibacteraceae bacterium]|nr:restriction endonuclease subunit S [Acutalibacteraceae bacterium]